VNPIEPLPSDLEALLGSERRCPEPSPELRARLRGRLQATIPVAWPSGGGPASKAPQTPRSTLAGAAGIARKLLLPVIAFGAGAGSVALLRAQRPAAAPAAILRAPPPPPPAPVPAAPPQPAAAPASPRATPRPPPAPGGDAALAEESALLERARTALSRGRSAAALDALSEHARRFPRGSLAEERDALRVQALVQAGRGGEARARALEFRRRFPQSLSWPAVQAALKSIP